MFTQKVGDPLEWQEGNSRMSKGKIECSFQEKPPFFSGDLKESNEAIHYEL